MGMASGGAARACAGIISSGLNISSGITADDRLRPAARVDATVR